MGKIVFTKAISTVSDVRGTALIRKFLMSAFLKVCQTIVLCLAVIHHTEIREILHFIDSLKMGHFDGSGYISARGQMKLMWQML